MRGSLGAMLGRGPRPGASDWRTLFAPAPMPASDWRGGAIDWRGMTSSSSGQLKLRRHSVLLLTFPYPGLKPMSLAV